jgi:hypothetical protein
MEGLVQWADKRLPVGTLLYAHPSPAQREPLSDAQIAVLHNSASAGVQFLQSATVRQLVRATERAHGITTSGTKGAARTEDTAPAAGERANDEAKRRP